TRPKSVSTPTLPVGMDVVLHNNNTITTIASPICTMREPAKRIFGSCGTEPPKSPPPRVTFTIHCLHRAASRSQRRAHRSIIYYARQAFRFLGAVGIECANGLMQPDHYILWYFRLTAQQRCGRIRANIVRHLGNAGLHRSTGAAKARRSLRGNDMQFLPGFTVQ